MKFQISLFTASLLMSNLAFAQMIERPKPVALDSQFVPVNLDALANNRSTLEAPPRESVRR